MERGQRSASEPQLVTESIPISMCQEMAKERCLGMWLQLRVSFESSGEAQVRKARMEGDWWDSVIMLMDL